MTRRSCVNVEVDPSIEYEEEEEEEEEDDECDELNSSMIEADDGEEEMEPPTQVNRRVTGTI